MEQTSANHRREKLLAIGLGGLILVALGSYLLRVRDGNACDFLAFWAAGRHVIEHGTRLDDSLLYRYLPSLDVAWAIFGWMPLAVAAIAYFAFSCGTWVGLLATVHRHLLAGVAQTQRRWVVLLAATLTIIFTMDHLMLGAFHILMLWLLVAGLARVMRGQTASGACLVGAAIWLKLLPLLAVPYLLLKRQWKAAGLSLLVPVALDVVLSVAAFGPAGAWTEHKQWWKGHAVGDLHALLSEPAAISDQRDRNQSLAAVLRRNLTHMGADPVRAERRGLPQPIADLSSRQVKIVYFALTGLAAAGLAWYWRRPATEVDQEQAGREIATVCLATMWFSPILFGYHPIAALPALAILVGSHEAGWTKRGTLSIWIVATVLLGLPQARFVGEIVWASAVVGIAMVNRPTVSGPKAMDAVTDSARVSA